MPQNTILQGELERLIKQKVPFVSPTAKAEVGLMYINYLMQNDMQQFFRTYDITSQQYNVLRILRGQHPNPANINMIKERMLDKMCDASRIVDRLMKMDLVVKKSNNVDKRNTDVFITKQALNLLSMIDTELKNKKSLLNALGDQEIDIFNQLINKILIDIK